MQLSRRRAPATRAAAALRSLAQGSAQAARETKGLLGLVAAFETADSHAASA
jgi:hypothetical protein